MTQGSESPSNELATNGPDVESSVREALTSLAGRPNHDPTTGRFIAGGQAATKAGARSEVLWAALAPAKEEIVAAVMRDLGTNGDTPTTLAGLIDGYAEARLFRSSMFVRLAQEGGAVTAKGKTRALYTAYCAALDRELKLATTIGLERRAKQVDIARALSGGAE